MIKDPVYEEKSMQSMIDLAKLGYFPKGSKVLYAHMGGAWALNGYSYTYRKRRIVNRYKISPFT